MLRTIFNRFQIHAFLGSLLGFYACFSSCALAADSVELAKLQQSVEALPAGSVKRVVLQVGIERVQTSIDAKQHGDADALIGDISKALQQDETTFTTTSTDTKSIGTLMPLRVTENNPYLKRLVAGAKSELSRADLKFVRSTEGHPVFDDIDGDYGARECGWRMEAFWWLYIHPSSPLKGDGELLARLLRRSHAYVDEIIQQDKPLKVGARIYDAFAMGPASAVLREIAMYQPGLLLPSDKLRLDKAMRLAGDKLYAEASVRKGEYCNIDLATACQLLNFGLYLRDQSILDTAKFLVDAQEKALLPDGGFRYIWNQNESAGYHDTDIDYLARYYEISQYKKAVDLIKASEWHGPVSNGRLGEFWTAPSWKHTWNNDRGAPCGGEPVVYLTGNPYVRTMLDTQIARSVDVKSDRSWYWARRAVAWYRNDVTPKVLPDNYTITDRNIVGPRAWYGRFSYAATLRNIPTTEPGLATLMGVQVTDPDSRLNAAVMGVYPRVRVKQEKPSADNQFDKFAWAAISSDLKASSIIGKSYSVTAGVYDLFTFGSSRKGVGSDWKGKQLWLGLPDRVIGVVMVEPTKEGALAYEINGVVRLGFGGSAYGTPKKIEPLAAESFNYGDLFVKIHHNSFANLKPVIVPFRSPNAPTTEITMSDLKEGAKAPAKPTAHPQSDSYAFTVEVRNKQSNKDASVQQSYETNGLIHLLVNCEGKNWNVWFNPTSKAISQTLPVLENDVKSTCRLSDVAVDSAGQNIPKVVDINPYQSVVIIQSADMLDHESGWKSYEEMVSSHK